MVHFAGKMLGVMTVLLRIAASFPIEASGVLSFYEIMIT